MTQRERIMARLQTMPDASLHEVETFLEFLQFKHSAFDCPLPEQLNGALERWGSMPEGLDVRLDIFGTNTGGIPAHPQPPGEYLDPL